LNLHKNCVIAAIAPAATATAEIDDAQSLFTDDVDSEEVEQEENTQPKETEEPYFTDYKHIDNSEYTTSLSTSSSEFQEGTTAPSRRGDVDFTRFSYKSTRSLD
jgi:hypothetical protein